MRRLFLCLCLTSLFYNAYQESLRTDLLVTDDEDVKPEVTLSHASKEKRQSYRIFTPTNEWQTVPEGMAVPQGAHIRMNMKTGVNEVKLMDESKQTKDSAKHSPQFSVLSDGEEDVLVNSRHKVLSQEELNEALAGIKPEEIVTDEDRERVSNTYKPIEELRKDFENISASITTDFQILKRHVNELQSSNGDVEKDRLLFILDEIEYLSHQFDNGIELTKMGGVPILLRYANSSDDTEIVESALLCLGSAMQSNRFVQEAVLKGGVIPIVYKLFSHSESRVRSRALYALSTLLRQFPLAQEQFLQGGGVSTLKRLFTACAAEPPFNEKIAVKIVGLVGDLVSESDEAQGLVSYSETTPLGKAEINQRQEYARFNMRGDVVAADWCDASAALVSSSRHDTREKALRLMLLLEKDCYSTYKSLHSVLSQLHYEYAELIKSNDDQQLLDADSEQETYRQPVDSGEDYYYERMAETISKLMKSLFFNSPSNSHTEL